MPRRPAPLPPPGPHLLEGDLDVFSIRTQWEALSGLAAGGGMRVLDLSGAGDLDPSGMQLLAVLDRDLRAQGGGLTLTGVPAGWRERFEGLGLTGLLDRAGA